MKKLIILAIVVYSAALNGMNVYVETHLGTKITLDVEPSDGVDNLKAKIFDELNIQPECQKLTFNGIVLSNDNATLSDYNIQRYSVIQLSLKTPNFILQKNDTTVSINTLFAINIPENTFEFAPDTVIVKTIDNTDLPNWLSFDFSTMTITGSTSQTDTVEIVLFATNSCDALNYTTDTFSIFVKDFTVTNVFPVNKNCKFFPNPVTSNITLSDYILGYKYFIYNSTGIMVKSGLIDSNLIECNSLNQGVYHFQIKGKQKIESYSFIKE